MAGKKHSEILTIRVKLETKLQPEMMTQKEDKSLNSYVNKILNEYFFEKLGKNKEPEINPTP